jgi:HK97 family phage portal protein
MGPEEKPTHLKDQASHPLMRMIGGGIPGVLTGLSIRMLTHVYLDVLGEAFWVLDRTNGLGTPSMAWPVPPYWIIDTPRADYPGYKLQIPGSQTIDVPMKDVIWFKEPDPIHPYLRGSSTANALADEIQTDENAAKFINRFFYNNARPSLIVSADGLSPESTKRIEEEWNRNNQGIWNSFRVHFLNRKVDVQVLDQNLQHLQFTELRQAERNTIIQVYGVPPEILGIVENSNRATIEAADYMMAKWVIVPRLAMFDAHVMLLLVPLYDEALIYKHDDPVPENKEFASRVALDANSGAITMVDERRKMLGLDPLPNGQGRVFLVPLNYIAVGSPAEATLPEAFPDLPPEGAQEPKVEVAPQTPQPEKMIAKQADVTRILFELEGALKRMMGKVRPIYRLTMKEIATSALKELGVDDPFNLSSANVLRFLNKQAASKIEGTLKTTRRELRTTLVEGLEARENLAQLAQRVSEVFEDAKGARAWAIARTETGRAANFANVEAYEQSRVVEGKTWLATRDDKTRETHREADGQTVALEEKFTVGDDELDYPLDPAADPGETINCRCTTTAILREGKALHITDEQKFAAWKRFDVTVRSHSRRFRTELVRGFQDLQNEVMDRLKEAGEE